MAEVARTSAQPGQLGGLIRLIKDEMGYPLYQAVSGVKAALVAAGRAGHAELHATRGSRSSGTITRAEFEDWIAPELAQLAAAVDRALAQASLDGRRRWTGCS